MYYVLYSDCSFLCAAKHDDCYDSANSGMMQYCIYIESKPKI